jgi:hypothetical protein
MKGFNNISFYKCKYPKEEVWQNFVYV